MVTGNLGHGREGKWGDLEEARKESVSDTIRMWEMFIDARKYGRSVQNDDDRKIVLSESVSREGRLGLRFKNLCKNFDGGFECRVRASANGKQEIIHDSLKVRSELDTSSGKDTVFGLRC